MNLFGGSASAGPPFVSSFKQKEHGMIRKLNAHSAYDILCGEGLLSRAGEEISSRFGKSLTAYIISDTNVFPLYGGTLVSSLETCGINHRTFVFPAGEASKNTDTLIDILNDMANSALSRSDVVIALGGGVVGDISGLAASLYERGVRCIQIPTTLLAAVDSSVGGKTAVNLSAGKNLCGAFHRPSLVLYDMLTIKTLSEECIGDGMAEMIKYGIISDEELFCSLSHGLPEYDMLSDIICRCIQIKIDVVEADEFEGGIRMFLNYGHTFAHAIEKLSSYSVSHGHAVAIGSVMAARAAEALSLCDGETHARILSAIEKASLPTSSPFCARDMYECMLNDKKRRGDCISLILPVSIGKCVIKKFTLSDLRSLMEIFE